MTIFGTLWKDIKSPFVWADDKLISFGDAVSSGVRSGVGLVERGTTAVASEVKRDVIDPAIATVRISNNLVKGLEGVTESFAGNSKRITDSVTNSVEQLPLLLPVAGIIVAYLVLKK